MSLRRNPRLLFAGLAAIPLLALAALTQPGSQQETPATPAEVDFHRAFYLEHSGGDLLEARALYERAADAAPDSELRARASAAAAGVKEELAARDFTRLLPKTTLAYAELAEPGERLAGLLSEVGLLGDRSWQHEGRTPVLAGISPLLVKGLLGVRGACVGITRFDPMAGQPVGIAILHPGDVDVARGLTETLIQNGAVPADPIHGCATWSIAGQAFVTFTQRLVIASQSAREITGVIRRLESGGESFADAPALTATADLRGEDLLFFCVNVEPVMPLAQMGLAFAAQQQPELALAASLFDLGSLRAVAGRVGLGREGLGLDLAMQLKEGHRNRAYNFLRMPSADASTLDLVPEGAAFVLATGLNEPSAMSAGIVDSKGAPVVSWMDLGREVFGNISDVVLFGMPSAGEESMGGVPAVAAILRVSDPERSLALWELLLGTATQASSQGRQRPQTSEVAGANVTSYSIDGQALHLARSGSEIVVSPSLYVLERALVARERGYSVRDDEVFAGAFEGLAAGRTLALIASPSRLGAMAEPFAPENERENLLMACELLDQSVVCLDLTHSETRLAINLDLAHLPDLSGLAAERLTRALSGTPFARPAPPEPAPLSTLLGAGSASRNR